MVLYLGTADPWVLSKTVRKTQRGNFVFNVEQKPPKADGRQRLQRVKDPYPLRKQSEALICTVRAASRGYSSD